MSCGAAALSTLLTYEFKDNTPETAIVVWILHRVDPVKVRARGGFSLLDLKRFAQARGYHAEGYAGMSIEELVSQKSAVIVPIRLKAIRSLHCRSPDHSRSRHHRRSWFWKSHHAGGSLSVSSGREVRIVFVVHPPTDLMMTEKKPTIASRSIPDPSIIQRGIGVAIPPNYLY